MRILTCLVVGAVSTGIAGCAPRAGSEVAPRMVGHFQNASQLYLATAEGRLADVHATAAELLERETGAGVPAQRLAHVEELQAFARLASTAPDLRSAASAVSRVGAACGSCHRSMKRGPRYEIVAGPPSGSSPLVTRMIRHRWAADRLWDGLVEPSDESWRAGAAVLRDAPLYTDALTQDVAQYETVTKLAWTVHDVGARANTARTQAERASLYGDLLATCASCHQLLRVPGADRGQ